MLRYLLFTAALLMATMASTLTADEVKGMAIGETEARVEALNKAAANADEKTVAFIQAMSDDALKTKGDKVFVVKDGKAFDPVTGAETPLPTDAEDVINPNVMRGEMDTALAALKLFSKDEKVRRDAVKTLASENDEARLPLIEKAYAAETVLDIKSQLELVRAALLLGSSDKAKRLIAAGQLAHSKNPVTKTVLIERLAKEPDADVRVALQAALTKVQASLAWGDKLGAIFSGISLGSILLLVALGLAITYGLMGVINMAHGELMMIGAYATYVVQGLFQKYLPGAFDWYLLAALPVAFFASALMGAALERSVIRFLYGRPLETLLATWGISLMLQQLVRSIFGAQNVAVENPVWMSGGVQVLGNLSLPYNRLVIIGFAIAVLLGFFLFAKWLVGRKFGRVLQAIRDAETRVMFSGYNPLGYKLSIWVISAIMCGVAGALYVPQVGIINPSEMSPANSIEIAIWAAVGGRATLIGPIVGAFIVNGAKSWLTVAYPEFWLYFLGALFIGVTLFLPNGVVGLVKKLRKEKMP